ncbi:MAG: rhodanese-like domain-containing protein [Stenotrophomonas sp.]
MIGWIKSLLGLGGEQLSPQEAMNRIDKGALLVDVRELHEFKDAHAPVAYSLPLGRIRAEGAAAINTLRLPDDATEILLVCQSGMRSRMAQAALSKDGRHRYLNVTGGMSAWAAAGLPVVRGK